MKSYRQNTMEKTQMTSIKIVKGERLETKIERMITNKEPIGDEVPLLYTDRKDGVNPDYNIRANKWDIAADALDSVEKSIIARSDAIAKKEKEEAEKAAEKEADSQSIHGEVTD